MTIPLWLVALGGIAIASWLVALVGVVSIMREAEKWEAR